MCGTGYIIFLGYFMQLIYPCTLGFLDWHWSNHYDPFSVSGATQKGIGKHDQYQTTTRTTRMPAFWGYPLLPHDYPCYCPVHIGSKACNIHHFILDPKSKQDKITKFKNLPKLQILEFWNKNFFYTWHNFLNCLIRCVNMKWIQWVL